MPTCVSDCCFASSNSLRHLTKSSLGDWRRGWRVGALEVHPGIWDVASNEDRQKAFVIVLRCSASPIAKNLNQQERRKNVSTVFGFPVRNSPQTKVAFWPYCNPSFLPLPLLISQSRRQLSDILPANQTSGLSAESHCG